MNKNYFYTYDKIDFSKRSDKFCQDWYDRGRASNNARYQDYCANRALRVGEKVAAYETQDFYKQSDKYTVSAESFAYGDEDTFHSEIPIELIDTNSDLVSNYYAGIDRNAQSKEEIRRQKQINALLYDTLMDLASESIYMRMTIAQYLYNAHYDEVMSERQKDYWRADFQLFELWEEEGKNTAQTLYLSWDNEFTENTRRWQHYEMLNKLKKAVLKFRDMYSMETYNPKKMARVVMPVKNDFDDDDDEDTDDMMDKYYEDEFAMA